MKFFVMARDAALFVAGVLECLAFGVGIWVLACVGGWVQDSRARDARTEIRQMRQDENAARMDALGRSIKTLERRGKR